MVKHPPYKVIEISVGAFKKSNLEYELNEAAFYGYKLIHLFVKLHDGNINITAVMELLSDSSEENL